MICARSLSLLQGLANSPKPLKIPFVTNQSVAAGVPSALSRRYAVINICEEVVHMRQEM